MTTWTPEAERFLRALEAALSALPREERQDVVAELRSDLAERAARGDPDPLPGFGSAEAYAAGFVQARALRSALASGTSFALARALLAGARRLAGWYLVAVLVVLQVYGAGFLLCAALKPFFPAHVGLFVGAGGVSFGAVGGDALATHREVLGGWAIPAFLVPGVVALWAGNRGLRLLAERRLRTLGGPAAAGAR